METPVKEEQKTLLVAATKVVNEQFRAVGLDDTLERLVHTESTLRLLLQIVFSLYLPRKWFYSFLPDTRKPA